MTAVKYIGGIIRGTAAERAAYVTTNLRAGWLWVETDTFKIYFWTGSAWSLVIGYTSPLAVAEGGSGVGTLSGILKGNGTSAFTAVTAPSGTILGTTDIQTITNKLISTGSVIDKNVAGSKKWNTTRRHGGFNGLSWEGMLFSATETGGVDNASSSIGRFTTYTTSTADLANAGAKISNIAYRKFNPYLKMMFRPNTTTVQSGWFGFSSSSTDPTGDTEATAKSYFAVGFRTTDTTYQIIRNDGSTPATYVDTTVTINSTVHTWEIIADEAGTRWGWSVDGGAITYYTTIIPASTTLLTLNLQMELLSGGVARAFDLLALDYESDG